MSIGNEGQQKNKSIFNKNIQSKLLLRHLAAGDKELLKLTHQLKALNLNIIDVFKQLKSKPEDVKTLQSKITENKKSTLIKPFNCYSEVLMYIKTAYKLLTGRSESFVEAKKEELYLEGILNNVIKNYNESKSKFLYKIKCDKNSTFIGYSYQIQQILHQLIDNANCFNKNSKNKEVVITVELLPHTIAANTERILQFTVHDNGQGIPKETLQQINNDFRDISQNSEALGLSLTFVKLMLQEIRGKITMKSEENKYTEAICDIPVSLANC
ncbi:ATP-binding protein [Orientia tsutsugamushi str. Gilliam]|uniref:ATP-binding protein n=3 Tax=Orientia tsutsugamushi TaxID=784 RepID=A0A2U3QZG9_ORITS|nr:sensor histidine kinase [Orientia tsutsugamushi]SPR06338.1 ATP-binding protein [Orientia tsutsugamushi str. Gilliam]